MILKNKSPKYYIKQAGGFTSYANKKKIFVFKANGEMVINPKKIDIGDSIYIQEKIQIKNKTFSFKNFSNILSPLVQALTAAALIKSL